MYFGFQFAKAAKTLPGYAVRHYVDTLATDPEALLASFAIYRALDATIAQNEERRTRRLTLPVLAIGGAEGIGEGAANTMRLAADDVQSVVIPGSGHYYSRGGAGGADHVPGPLSGRARPRRATPKLHSAGSNCHLWHESAATRLRPGRASGLWSARPGADPDPGRARSQLTVPGRRADRGSGQSRPFSRPGPR